MLVPKFLVVVCDGALAEMARSALFHSLVLAKSKNRRELLHKSYRRVVERDSNFLLSGSRSCEIIFLLVEIVGALALRMDPRTHSESVESCLLSACPLDAIEEGISRKMDNSSDSVKLGARV